MNDFTKGKFAEWRAKLGPIVREIVVSNKNEPQAAAEALILVMLQIVHHLARHDVLLEYGERLGDKAVQSIAELDRRTAALILALVKKGGLSDEDFKGQVG